MSSKPFILLTNDDGFDAAGLQALIDALDQMADLIVVAPAFERSGASHSISVYHDLALQERDPDRYAFDGTPVDCVQFALRNLVNRKPDLIISGINHGANLGNDTLYSGTVGAAMAGCAEGITALAVSLVNYRHHTHYFETAVSLVVRLVKQRHALGGFHNRVLNINVPNVPIGELKGTRLCSLGERIYSEEFVPGKLPGSFRYNHSEPINFGGHNVDVTEIQAGYATVSVLRPLLFDKRKQEELDELVAGKRLVFDQAP